jgi:ABC-2 type transport system permease protein
VSRFGGVIRSEWIKFRSLRSSLWALLAILLVEVAVGLGMAQDVLGSAGMVPHAAVVVATTGLTFNQLIAVVLGVLVVSNEYSTGQMRTSLTAVPDRLAVLAAKAVTLAAAIFVTGFVAIVLTYAATVPVLLPSDQQAQLGSPSVWLGLLGGAGYLSLTGLIGMAVAVILRSSAFSITLTLGLFFIASTFAPWLPGSAGPQMFNGGGIFSPWQAFAIMLAWVGAPMLGGATLLKKRDA